MTRIALCAPLAEVRHIVDLPERLLVATIAAFVDAAMHPPSPQPN